MKSEIYIPPSGRTAEKHLALAFKRELQTLVKIEFIRAWCSLAYLYPGLHPDGFGSRGSGWPKAFKPLAAEAWRRFESGELTDNELYCYQACKARLIQEKGVIALESTRKPWFFTDHFAA
jgi:hypothetical protein